MAALNNNRWRDNAIADDGDGDANGSGCQSLFQFPHLSAPAASFHPYCPDILLLSRTDNDSCIALVT